MRLIATLCVHCMSCFLWGFFCSVPTVPQLVIQPTQTRHINCIRSFLFSATCSAQTCWPSLGRKTGRDGKVLQKGLVCQYVWPKHVVENKTGNVLWRNLEARSRNHCCCGKTISITHSECVSVALCIRHAMRMCHIVICGFRDSTIFLHAIS